MELSLMRDIMKSPLLQVSLSQSDFCGRDLELKLPKTGLLLSSQKLDYFTRGLDKLSN